MEKLPGLKEAYGLKDADAVRDLYAEWAPSYDVGFGDAMGYQLPREVALAYVGAGGQGPVLDVGAGTGLVGDHLAAAGIAPQDALDLSAEMLEVARSKSVYRELYAADLFATDAGPMAGSYAGLVSAGTFTHGHIGPEGLAPVLRWGASGALCVLSINAAHFAERGFDTAFDALSDAITDLTFTDVRIYDDRAPDDHRDDVARLAVFRLR